MLWYLRGAGLEPTPFFLTLAAGALCGVSFTGWVQGPGSTQTKLAVHIVVVAVLVTALVLLTKVTGWAVLRQLPAGWIGGTALFLSFASLPFTTWTALGLFGRFLFPLGRTRAARPTKRG
ncbi:hypothetical protein [Glaciihabitans sp. UYNi722]|uniref:hypothetical protein n=1 Tax=Glaciihabitans sp. UYNi722 TaxID=3156344 RepID=UPI003397731F